MKVDKNFLKLTGGFVALVVVGLLLLWGGQWFTNRPYTNSLNNEEGIKNYEKLEKAYREDPYGGDTPEQTLQLFIDALKAGDVDLASKYFLPDEWEKWRENLQKVKDSENLDEMVNDLQRPRDKKVVGDAISFYISNDQSELAIIIDLVKGLNGKWKILDL